MRSSLVKSGLTLASPGCKRWLSILIYHRVVQQPDPLLPGLIDVHGFDDQIATMARSFNLLPLQEAIERLAEGKLPPRAAAGSDRYNQAMPLTIETVAAQHIGDRSEQQDRVAIFAHPTHKGALLAVLADGMGGHSGGSLAAEQVLFKARHAFEAVVLEFTQLFFFLIVAMTFVSAMTDAGVSPHYEPATVLFRLYEPRATHRCCTVETEWWSQQP